MAEPVWITLAAALAHITERYGSVAYARFWLVKQLAAEAVRWRGIINPPDYPTAGLWAHGGLSVDWHEFTASIPIVVLDVADLALGHATLYAIELVADDLGIERTELQATAKVRQPRKTIPDSRKKRVAKEIESEWRGEKLPTDEEFQNLLKIKLAANINREDARVFRKDYLPQWVRPIGHPKKVIRGK